MKLRTPLALTGAAALAVTTGLVTTANPSQAAATPSSAYGFSAEGPLALDPTPVVTSTNGETVTDNAGEIPDNPLVTAGLLELMAGNNRASVTVADVAIGKVGDLPAPPQAFIDGCNQLTGELPEGQESPLPLPVDQLPRELAPIAAVIEDPTALCDYLTDTEAALVTAGLIDVSCEGNTGNMRLLGLKVAGQPVPIPSDVPENFGTAGTPLAAIASITANRQTQNGGVFEVKGLEVVLGGTQTLNFAGVTCGQRVAQTAARPPAQQPAPRAEAPEPVRQSVPVTG
jgi:hypothetical protein